MKLYIFPKKDGKNTHFFHTDKIYIEKVALEPLLIVCQAPFALDGVNAKQHRPEIDIYDYFKKIINVYLTKNV